VYIRGRRVSRLSQGIGRGDGQDKVATGVLRVKLRVEQV
jgi:hypothetical protein